MVLSISGCRGSVASCRHAAGLSRWKYRRIKARDRHQRQHLARCHVEKHAGDALLTATPSVTKSCIVAVEPYYHLSSWLCLYLSEFSAPLGQMRLPPPAAFLLCHAAPGLATSRYRSCRCENPAARGTDLRSALARNRGDITDRVRRGRTKWIMLGSDPARLKYLAVPAPPPRFAPFRPSSSSVRMMTGINRCFSRTSRNTRARSASLSSIRLASAPSVASMSPARSATITRWKVLTIIGERDAEAIKNSPAWRRQQTQV